MSMIQQLINYLNWDWQYWCDRDILVISLNMSKNVSVIKYKSYPWPIDQFLRSKVLPTPPSRAPLQEL